MVYKKPVDRFSFSKFKESIDMPNLIEIQQNSYNEFLQKDTPPNKRENVGLQKVFTEILPIKSYDGTITLEFEDCSHATMTYELIAADVAGSFPLIRILEDNAAQCTEVTGGPAPFVNDEG